MAVRAINVPVAKSAAPVAAAPAVDITSECVAALTLHLAPETQNIGEASRCIARARLAGVDLATVQKRCFDNGVSGTLLKRALVLSRDITPEALAKSDAASSLLQVRADKTRIEAAKAKREATNNAPLKVKAFAVLKLG